MRRRAKIISHPWFSEPRRILFSRSASFEPKIGQIRRRDFRVFRRLAKAAARPSVDLFDVSYPLRRSHGCGPRRGNGLRPFPPTAREEFANNGPLVKARFSRVAALAAFGQKFYFIGPRAGLRPASFAARIAGIGPPVPEKRHFQGQMAYFLWYKTSRLRLLRYATQPSSASRRAFGTHGGPSARALWKSQGG